MIRRKVRCIAWHIGLLLEQISQGALQSFAIGRKAPDTFIKLLESHLIVE